MPKAKSTICPFNPRKWGHSIAIAIKHIQNALIPDEFWKATMILNTTISKAFVEGLFQWITAALVQSKDFIKEVLQVIDVLSLYHYSH